MFLTRQLALEYAEDSIRVLTVSPGTIETPMLLKSIDQIGGDEDETRVQIAKSHPLGRIDQPNDIAKVVLFLARKNASFMTGENIYVDGGLMAKGAWEN